MKSGLAESGGVNGMLGCHVFRMKNGRMKMSSMSGFTEAQGGEMHGQA
jgi:hypothetical protein